MKTKTIQLFNVQSPVIDSSKFDNLLHDKIRNEVEQQIADFVGAKYAVAVSSATDAIFLSLKSLQRVVTCTVPSLVTTRFLSAFSDAGCDYEFTDDTIWVGHEYVLYESDDIRIIDSAQRFDKGQFKKECNDSDLLIFSHYPTKPLGGLEGGTIVSNNKEKIEWIRQASLFGEKFNKESWNSETSFKGWQMYMNAIKAAFIKHSLKNYAAKRQRLDDIREMYFKEFQHYVITGDSYHLYRMYVEDNEKFKRFMNTKGIVTGIHYKPAHLDPIYNQGKKWACISSEYAGKQVASIPFHEKLSNSDVKYVINCIKDYFKRHKV